LLLRRAIRDAAQNACGISKQLERDDGSRREESLRLLSGCAVQSALRTRPQRAYLPALGAVSLSAIGHFFPRASNDAAVPAIQLAAANAKHSKLC
jgi:hypothetical protein